MKTSEAGVRSSMAAYGVSLGAVAVAVVARLLLDPLLADRLPFITLFLAVCFAAWHGGRGPGLLALVAGAIAADYFLFQPRYSFALDQPADQTGFVVYGIVGLGIISMLESLRNAQRQTEAQRRQLVQEVAARRAAELASAEQAERLRVTLASVGDAVITTDTKGRITNMNLVAESLTGWTDQESVGQPLDAVFRIVNESTRQPALNPALTALRDGAIVNLANHTILIAKDGTERPIDDSAAPIRTKGGEVIGCVLVFRDVTERRHMERLNAERLEIAAQLASIVDSSQDPIISKSLDGIILTWNPAAQRLFGYTEGQALGRHISFLIPADRVDEENGIVARLLAGERVEHYDTVRVRNDGQTVDVSLTISPIQDAEGRIVRASKIVRDVTERKRQEEALRQLAADLSEADRRKDEFLAFLAHELRNPLVPIRNGLELLKLSGGQAATVERVRGMMERQLLHVVRLVDDLMDINRITRGKIELRKERGQLMCMVNSAVDLSRPHITEKGHELTVTVPELPVFVDADLTRLAQVFSNLLNNAAKYTEPGGRIVLAAERQGGDVVVSVQDTGIGIAADQLPHVFDLFTQVHCTAEHSRTGLGIGLTLVERLVEMHGGSVEAKSDGPGKGSEFIVRLPVVVEASGPKSSGVENEPASPKSPLRILIVDDYRDNADSLAILLRRTGNETRTAYDGLEGVDVAGEFQPDMIVLDIGLPKLNGYEACRRIREQSWGKGVVMIAATGLGQDYDRRRSHEAGFDHHLVKPVDPQALMKIAALVASSRKSNGSQ